VSWITRGNNQVASYERPFRLPLQGAKCCCYQEVISNGPAGPNGSVVETCWWFVPQLNVIRPDGTVEWKIAPPTCVGGMCVNICAEGLCDIPFYVFPPESGTTKEEKVGYITKILGGSINTIDATKFEVEFPPAATPDSKARLLGALFLINQIFFERSGGVLPKSPLVLLPYGVSKEVT
jgi:hypothetical protein